MANTYKKVFIGAGGSGSGDAVDVAYDNTTSGLSSTNIQGAVDELALSTGAAYIGNFLVASWVLDSPQYVLEILEATHGRGGNPIVQVYQSVGLNYEEVQVGIELTNAGNIALHISENPDLRFDGKIIIK